MSSSRTCGGLLFRAGMLLIQCGTTPAANVYVHLLHNAIDLAVSSVVYCLFGYFLAFSDGSPFAGNASWFSYDDIEADTFVWGWTCTIMSTAVICTSLSGRLDPIGLALLDIVYCGIYLPLVMRFVWNQEGLLQLVPMQLLDAVPFMDNYGSAVVHLCSGTVALVGCWWLAKRLLRVNDLSECSIGIESPGSTFLGYFLVAGGCVLTMDPIHMLDTDVLIYATHRNGVLSAAMGIAGGVFGGLVVHSYLTYTLYSYWMVLKCLQSGLGGLVAVLAGAEGFSPIAALLVGFLNAPIFFFVSNLVHNSFMDDYPNIIGIHLASGAFGTTVASLLSSNDEAGFLLANFVWQLTVASMLFLATLLVSGCIFLVADECKCLRNSWEMEEHNRSLRVAFVFKKKMSVFGRMVRLRKMLLALRPGCGLIRYKDGRSDAMMEQRIYSVATPHVWLDLEASGDVTQQQQTERSYYSDSTNQVSELSKAPIKPKSEWTASIETGLGASYYFNGCSSSSASVFELQDSAILEASVISVNECEV